MLTTQKRWAVNHSALEDKIYSFQPTESQKEVMKGLQNWFKLWQGKPIYKEPAIVQGFAGSGKSTLVSQVILSFISDLGCRYQDEFRVALIAPTNRAKEVLRSFSSRNELWKFCKVSVFTTHSLGGMIVSGVDAEGYLNDLWEEKSDQSFDLVVVDEYSMIDDFKIYPALLPLMKKFPFLFMGDLNQLSPVIDKRYKSEIKPGCSIVNINHPNYVFELKEVVRYSGSLLEYSHEILSQYSEDTKVVSLPEKNSKDGQLSLANIEDFDRILVTKISDLDLLNRDILDFKVLCYSNDRVNFWNKKIRRHLFPGLEDYSLIQDRDHLIVKQPVYKVDSEGKTRLAFYTNEFFIPEGVENGVTKNFEDPLTGSFISDLIFQRIYAKNTYGSVEFLFPLPESLIKISQYGIARISEIKLIADFKERKESYNSLINLLRTYGLAYKNDPSLKNPFKRQVIPFYASTLHSCQGTTLREAVIDWDDIHTAINSDFKNMTGDLRKRLAYVACTRASEKITIISQSIPVFQDNFDDKPF